MIFSNNITYLDRTFKEEQNDKFQNGIILSNWRKF
jgi:hypothetical protein